ncbi:DUF1353 domain-containing protein [bacterium]|nr:DUF1353 domain-containing protein [bacterium]
MNREKVKNICFSEQPKVCVRVIDDSDPEAIKKQKKEYPFELHNTVNVTVITTFRQFTFTISKGFTWNGADIPRMFWRIIGARTDNDFLIASMLHDYLLEFKVFIINETLEKQITIDEYRRLTSLIFREKIKNQGTNVIKANIMAWCVDVFQICNKKGWKV